MGHIELLDTYNIVINEWKERTENKNGDVLDLIKRGLIVCENTHRRGLLLTGINPSFDEKKNDKSNIYFVFSNAEDQGRSRYWAKKHKQFGGRDSDLVQNHMGYLDLFPLKESRQLRFEKILRPYNDLRMLLLKKTQEEIERIDPKLIVHANKGSLYYWGLNPKTYQKDYENPWLNYDFDEIDIHDCPPLEEYAKRLDSQDIPKEKRFVHLYRITGNAWGKDSNHFFLAYIMEYYGMEDWRRKQLLKAEEMKALWEWCDRYGKGSKVE